MKKIISFLILAVMLACIIPFTAFAETEPSKGLDIAEGDYIIYPVSNPDKFLNIEKKALDGYGDNLGISSQTSSNKSNVFHFSKDAESGGYVIYGTNGMVLNITGVFQATEGNVNQVLKNGIWSQRWKFEDAGNGTYYIVSLMGSYLNVNGSNVEVHTPTGANNQKFRLERVGTVGSMISNGSIWIAAAVVVIAVAVVAAIVVAGKKKKKTAQAK